MCSKKLKGRRSLHLHEARRAMGQSKLRVPPDGTAKVTDRDGLAASARGSKLRGGMQWEFWVHAVLGKSTVAINSRSLISYNPIPTLPTSHTSPIVSSIEVNGI